jgi:hypothetical protein
LGIAIGWIKQVARALAAGTVARVRPQGAWVYPYFDGNDELTIAPVDPAPEICYDYLSAGAPPAEAWGDYGQITFAFRARYDCWDFVLSPDPEVAAEDVADLTWYDLDATQQSDHPFPEDQVAAFKRCFVRSGQYGQQDSFAASYMSREEVLRIIRECLAEYAWETAS